MDIKASIKRVRVIRGERIRGAREFDKNELSTEQKNKYLNQARKYRSKNLPFWASTAWLAHLMYHNEKNSVSINDDNIYLPNDVYRAIVLHKLNGAEHLRKKSDLFQKMTFVKCIRELGFADNVPVEYDTLKEVLAALDAGERVIAKRSISSKGRGNVVLEPDSARDDVRKMFSEAHSVFQKVMPQSSNLDVFNPASRNTLRIITARVGDELKILSTYGKFSVKSSELQDNIALGGVAAPVASSGALRGYGLDWNLNVVKTNPVNEYTLADLEWPCVKQSQDLVLQVHSNIGQFGVIGWDVLIGANEQPILLEANSDPGLILAQIFDGPVVSRRDYDLIRK